MGEYQLIIVMIGGMIGFALSVPAFWGILKWIEHRDMTRVDRMTRKLRKMERKR
jgi:hypothetical protein